jgi:hypothetical protein
MGNGTKYDEYHITRRGDAMGGVVLIEETIFYSQIIDPCGHSINAAYAFFVPYCRIVDMNRTCSISKDVLMANGINVNDPYNWSNNPSFDEVVYTDDLMDLVEENFAAGDTDFYDCENPPEDFHIRSGAESVQTTATFTCAPNPFQDKFMVKPVSQTAQGSFAVTVTDMMGKVMTKQQVDFAQSQSGYTIATDQWKTGLYLVHIGEGNNASHFKIVKR